MRPSDGPQAFKMIMDAFIPLSFHLPVCHTLGEKLPLTMLSNSDTLVKNNGTSAAGGQS